MSNLFNDNVIVCNCGGTMDIDGKKLAKACGMTTPCDVSTSLCRDETDRLASRSVSSRQSDVDTSHGVVMPHALASFLPSMSIVPPQLHTMTLSLKRLDIFGTSISIR